MLLPRDMRRNPFPLLESVRRRIAPGVCSCAAECRRHLLCCLYHIVCTQPDSRMACCCGSSQPVHTTWQSQGVREPQQLCSSGFVAHPAAWSTDSLCTPWLPPAAGKKIIIFGAQANTTTDVNLATGNCKCFTHIGQRGEAHEAGSSNRQLRPFVRQVAKARACSRTQQLEQSQSLLLRC